MDLTTLKAHIKTGNLNKYYIFTGPEVKVMDIYLNQMAKVIHGDLKSLERISEFTQKSRCMSFAKTNHIYVLRDDKDFLTDDKAQSYITQNKANTDDITVFIYTNIDKRSKLYKSQKDNIIEFKPLSTSILIRYIQKDIDLSEYNCNVLIGACESDYSRILLEIDKIKIYAHAKDIDYNTSLDILIREGTIFIPPKDAVFEFVDAVLKCKCKLAFKLLEDSYKYGEATMVLLSNLYNSTKQLLQVQSYQGDNLADATGLTPFQIKLAKGCSKYYSNRALLYFMRKLREVEKGIKTGEIEESVAIKYALVSFWVN